MPGTKQTVGKNLIWFREIKRKLAMPTFTYRSSSFVYGHYYPLVLGQTMVLNCCVKGSINLRIKTPRKEVKGRG